MSATPTVAIRPSAAREGRSYTSLLRDGKFARVIAAYGISEVGDGITIVALPLLAYGLTGSASTTALVFAAGASPRLLFGLWAGVLADRMSRRLLVVGSALLRALLLGLVPLVPELPVILAVAFLTQTLGVFEIPATEAALPALAGERYQQLAALRSALRQLSTSIGPALGGILVGLVGASRAVLFDAATFVIAAALIASVREFDRDGAGRRASARARRALTDLIAGLSYVRHNTIALGLTLYWTVGVLVLPLSLVAAIPYITSDLGRSARAYGFAVSFFAVGAAVGVLVAGKLSYRQHRVRWLLASGVGYGLAGLGLGLGPSYVVFCLLWLAWGLLYGPEEVLGAVLFAQATTDELRGRAYSVLYTGMGGATLLGYLLAGPLIDRFGAPPMMALAGAVFIVAALVAFGLSPLARAIRDQGSESVGSAR